MSNDYPTIAPNELFWISNIGSFFHTASCSVVKQGTENYHEYSYRCLQYLSNAQHENYEPHCCVYEAYYAKCGTAAAAPVQNVPSVAPGNWDLVRHTGIRVGKNERVIIRDGEVIVEHRTQVIDVTEECTVELRKSKQCDGYYVSINHRGKSIVALGVDENSKFIMRNNGYTMVKSPDGHVSFRIKSTRT